MRAITNAALLATLLAAPCAWADETSETSTSQTVSPQQRTEIEKEVARQLAERETSQWKFGVLPDGGGFFAHSPDDYYQFRILGEAQTVGTLVDADFVNSFGNGDVSIRRARVGSYFRLKQKYELFIQYDGAPDEGRLVEARADITWMGGDLRMRAGKMYVPLSEEGSRPTHDLDTIERFIALNAAHDLPAEDTQIGVMFHGKILADDRLTWYIGAWNGNASRESNARDSNDDREYQIKGTYRISPELRAGLGLGFSKEEDQTLRLSSLNSTPYAAFAVSGERLAQDADFFWERGRNSLRGEVLRFDFRDSDTELVGGFLQFAHFLWGTDTGGLQPLVRIERAEVERATTTIEDRTAAINALTAGVNWYINDHVRLQVNAFVEDFSRPADLGVRGEGVKPSLLTQIGMRF